MPQCIAKSKSTAKQCARPAIAGGAVCRVHGGAAPQVKAAAAARLLALVDPAIGVLAFAMNKKSGRQLPQALQAANSVLDRTGHGTKQTIEVAGDLVSILNARLGKVKAEAE